MSEKKEVSRRGYLKYAGAGIVVVAGAAVGGYYATRGPATPETPTLPDLPPSEDPILFGQWAWGPEIVRGYLDTFEDMYNENVAQEVFSGGDYGALLDIKFVTGAPLDVCYAFADNAHKWHYAGWIEDLNQVIENVDEIKKEMYPKVLEGLTAVDGALNGLPYFCDTATAPMANMAILREAGLDNQLPRSFDELHEQCELLKKEGYADPPYVPFWTTESFGFWDWFGHSHSLGDDMFDPKTLEPTFDVNTACRDVLEDWKMLWDKELVPHGLLTATEGDVIGWFATGNYAFARHNLYDIKRFNDPSFSNFAGDCAAIPVDKHPWGVMNNCSYVLSKHYERSPGHTKRVVDFMKFMGWRDKNGDLYIAKKWALLANLGSGYSAVLEEPEVLDAMQGWVHSPADIEAMKSVRENMWMPILFKAPWSPQFITQQNLRIGPVLLGELSINQAIEELRDLAEQFWKQYPVE
jgi:ABC-type glycerol-3-phosphate transport system substrate-binding protein